ncbi:CopG family transcriptional regulator [Archaeoglobales archaeon]|nr:MAG: CopG family transcriptional regulator [Archaeoglobales archaeon]
MGKKVISLSLSEKTVKRLDEASAALGMSRSELIEYMIEKGWHFPKEIEDTIRKISKLQIKAKAKLKEMK